MGHVAGYVDKKIIEHLLAALMPENRLALEVSLATGLRISDVLSLKADDLKRHEDGRWTVKESKTGKSKRICIRQLRARLMAIAGPVYIFSGRYDVRKPRCRQSVYKDIKRAAKAFRVKDVSSHSMRKVYAVEAYRRTGGDLQRVQQLLNHKYEGVTVLYALADVIQERRERRERSRVGK